MTRWKDVATIKQAARLKAIGSWANAYDEAIHAPFLSVTGPRLGISVNNLGPSSIPSF